MIVELVKIFMDYEHPSNSRIEGIEENTNLRPFASLSSLICNDTVSRKADKCSNIRLSRNEASPQTASQDDLPSLRRANDVARQSFPKEAVLFDEFWREGEIALLFGAESSGKSILAMQIADSVARGRGADGLKMTARRQKVLYIDLNLSERQFAARYGGTRLSANLYYYRPDIETDLAQQIQGFVNENGIRVVIVDSIDGLKRTLYGVRETLTFMRKMRAVSRQFGVSVLVAATDHVTGDRDMTPDQVAEYRLLCSAADSVFAIGRCSNNRDRRYIQQLRTRAAKIVWTGQDAPKFTIECDCRNVPRAVFDERFSPEIDVDLKAKLIGITKLRREGSSYRDIARHTGMSKTRVHELHRHWETLTNRWLDDGAEGRREVDNEIVFDKYYTRRDHQEDLDRYGFDPSFRDDVIDVTPVSVESVESTPMSLMVPYEHPFAAALGRRSILDMEQSQDQNGNEIYVDEWLPNKKPLIWYQRYKGKHYRRFTRSHSSIMIDDIRNGPFLERNVPIRRIMRT